MTTDEALEEAFEDEAKLKVAVRNAANRIVSAKRQLFGAQGPRDRGRVFSAHERAIFSGEDPPLHEQIARQVMNQVREALEELWKFTNTYQRHPESQVVRNLEGNDIPPAESFNTRHLLRFAEEVLPRLDPRVRAREDAKPIMIDAERGARLAAYWENSGNAPDGRPLPPPISPMPLAWWFEYQGGDWTIASTRGRVLAFLEQSDYWKDLGFAEAPDDRTLACISLVCGEWPSVNVGPGRPVTINQVIDKERNAIRAARHRAQGLTR